MSFEMETTVDTVTIKLRNKNMPPVDEVTKAITDQLHRVHPGISVRCIPGTSLSLDDDEPLVYEIKFDPGYSAGFINSRVKLALESTFKVLVKSTSNLSYG